MSVKIRLARRGSKKRPYYNIVVANSRCPRDGRFIEIIGKYNPLLESSDTNRVILDVEKAQDWINKGAQPTERVQKFLTNLGA